MRRVLGGVLGVLAAGWGVAWGQQAAPGIASDGGPVRPEAAGIARVFQDGLRSLGSEAVVEGCTTIVTVAPGVPGGPSAQGGVCAVRVSGKPVRVVMCDTEGVGGFALATSFTATEEAVREFVLRACPRG